MKKYVEISMVIMASTPLVFSIFLILSFANITKSIIVSNQVLRPDKKNLVLFGLTLLISTVDGVLACLSVNKVLDRDNDVLILASNLEMAYALFFLIWCLLLAYLLV